jgi:Bifunctional DNA primase/polymerase, N-terminal
VGKRWNIGVLLGASGLAVVEVDNEAARAKLLELLGGTLPAGVPIVETGRGFWHLYYADDGYRNAAGDGLELRCGAQQCVLPPSVHPDTGKPYTWLPGHEPWPA